MFFQTFSELNLFPISDVSLNKKHETRFIFSRFVSSSVTYVTFFCVSSYSNNFVQIDKPLLMIRFHAFICSRKREATNILLQNTSYILLLSVFYKPENVNMVSWR